MSVPSRALAFTPQARRDVEDIVLYTADQWGPDQAVQYSLTLDRAFELLLSHPYVGKAYDDLVPGLRGRRVGHHIVYYRITDEVIEIFRVLHERVDPTFHVRS